MPQGDPSEALPGPTPLGRLVPACAAALATLSDGSRLDRSSALTSFVSGGLVFTSARMVPDDWFRMALDLMAAILFGTAILLACAALLRPSSPGPPARPRPS